MTEKARTRGTWAYRGFVIAALGVIASQIFGFAPEAYDAIRHRTFDSPKQKNDVIKLLERRENISREEAETLRAHVIDLDRHMSANEKEQLIIIRENQKRIGQDLQEIKNLLRSR